MNILAINSNNFVNRQQIAMNQNHNKIGFGNLTRMQLAVDVFNKGKTLQIEQDVVNTLNRILTHNKERGIVDKGFEQFVQRRNDTLVANRAAYLANLNRYIRMTNGKGDVVADVQKAVRFV